MQAFTIPDTHTLPLSMCFLVHHMEKSRKKYILLLFIDSFFIKETRLRQPLLYNLLKPLSKPPVPFNDTFAILRHIHAKRFKQMINKIYLIKQKYDPE